MNDSEYESKSVLDWYCVIVKPSGAGKGLSPNPLSRSASRTLDFCLLSEVTVSGCLTKKQRGDKQDLLDLSFVGGME